MDAAGPVNDEMLHAFVDGQLDAAGLPAVLAWLRAHPADAARVLQWQAQRLELRQLARELDVGATPAALSRRLTAPRAGRRVAQAAAVLLLVAAAVFGGRQWGQGGTGPDAAVLAATPAFVHDAVRAHAVFVPEQRHPVEVAAADEAHLVQWLSRRLGVPLKVPVLGALGYRLLGGRLLPGDGTPRAQFMYENAAGTRVTLYVTHFGAPAPVAFRAARLGDEEAFYWTEAGFGYALSAPVDAAGLQALAREVHRQLASP